MVCTSVPPNTIARGRKKSSVRAVKRSPIRASEIMDDADDGNSFGLRLVGLRFLPRKGNGKEIMCPWARWMTNVKTGKAMRRDSLIRSFHMTSCTYWCAARKASVKCTVVSGREVNNVSIRGGISPSPSSSSSSSSFVTSFFVRLGCVGRFFGSRLDTCPVDESSRNCVSVAFRSMNCPPFGIWLFFFFLSLLFSRC